MATSAQVRAHRRDVRALSAMAENDLRTLFRGVNTPDDARDALLDVVPKLMGVYGSAGATLGADWYDDLRDAAGAPGRFRAITADLPDRGRADALARWAVSPMYKAKPDPATTLSKVTGGMQRIIANADRESLRVSAVEDKQAGWVRVGSGACSWCAQYIDGEVHYVEGYDFDAHDFCNCMVVPEYAGTEPTPVQVADPNEAAEKAVPALEPEPEFVEKLADKLRAGEVTPEQLQAAAAETSPLGRVNAEEALRVFAAEQQEAAAAARAASDAAEAATRERVTATRPSGTGSLSEKQYEALTPDKAWSPEKREAILDALRETDNGKVLADTLERFQDGGSIARLRTKIDKYLAGEKIDATSQARAEAILDAIRNAPDWSPDTLYRGMTVKGKLDNVIAKYRSGSTMDFNLTSFTSDRGVAKRFQNMTSKGGNETRVMVELVGDGKKTVPIQNLPKDRRLFKEKEWVSAGRYEIVDVKKSAGQVFLRIRQVGTP